MKLDKTLDRLLLKLLNQELLLVNRALELALAGHVLQLTRLLGCSRKQLAHRQGKKEQ